MELGNESAGPHGNQPVLTAGLSPHQAGATLILLHGRGVETRKAFFIFTTSWRSKNFPSSPPRRRE